MRVPVVSLISAVRSTGSCYNSCQMKFQRSGSTKAYVFLEGFAEHRSDVMAFRIVGPESFRPPNKNTMIDAFLPSRTFSVSFARRLIDSRAGIRKLAQKSANSARLLSRRTSKLTVNPSGILCPSWSCELPSGDMLVLINVCRHSAQKSNSFCPSSCF